LKSHYDFIIAGAGLSGLLTAETLSRLFPDKSILIADRFIGIRNDRTWCYWTDQPSPFPEAVSHSWKNIVIVFEGQHVQLDDASFRYEHISERDLRSILLKNIESKPGISFLTTDILSIKEHALSAELITSAGTVSADKIFQSIFPAKERIPGNYPLLQHFLGWEIDTSGDIFNPDSVTLMDFDVTQKHGFAFIYVLPFAANKALVELTLFSRTILPDSDYEAILSEWLQKHPTIAGKFTVSRKEKGVIPMNDDRVRSNPARSVIDIGTAGGWVKPSTGYAFKRTVDRVNALGKMLKGEADANRLYSSSLFFYFDKLMLHVLDRHPQKGPAIFFHLFRRRGFRKMFNFLDEKASFFDLLQIMMSVPPLPFVDGILASLTRKSPRF
jgi:lycopene beta-cyclase